MGVDRKWERKIREEKHFSLFGLKGEKLERMENKVYFPSITVSPNWRENR